MKKIEQALHFFWHYQVLFFLSFLKRVLGGQGRHRAHVLFSPALPHPRSIMYKICRRLGVVVKHDAARPYHLAVCWQDATLLQTGCAPANAVNGRCVDISKKNVSKLFVETFKYNLQIDPEKYNGWCVEKSDANAVHDGVKIKAPYNARLGKVYQILIDNQVDDRRVCDLRVPLMGTDIPFVFLKFKTMANRFSNEIDSVRLVETESVLSPEEITQITTFCRVIGLDCGELDVLRNSDDNKIYIVDVNKTPWGPPKHTGNKDRQRALRQLSELFFENFIKNSLQINS